MAHKGQTFDPHISALSAGNKFPRSSRANIKDRISMWEGKEPCGSLDHSPKKAEQRSTNSCSKVSNNEKEHFGRENGDSGSMLPADVGVKSKGSLRRPQPGENCKTEQQQQLGTLSIINEVKMTKQSEQDKKAVFTLFKRLEAMGENARRTPTELGNYFSPPSKDKQMEPKKEAEVDGQKNITVSSTIRPSNLENFYTGPGALPINPVPKPQRTFRHPASLPVEISQRQERGQRKLPPLPTISTKASSKPPSGVRRRARSERVRENIINRCMIAALHTVLRSTGIIVYIAHHLPKRQKVSLCDITVFCNVTKGRFGANSF